MNARIVNCLLTAMLLGAPAALAADLDTEMAKQRLAQTIRQGDWTGMRSQADALRSRGVDLGTEILYFEGRGALEQGDFATAERKFTEYAGRGPRVHYYSRALERLQTVRDKLAEAAAEEAKRAATSRAQATWQAANRIGRIVEVDLEWGFVKVELPDASRIREPLQAFRGEQVVKFGALKPLGGGVYSATIEGGVAGFQLEDVVFACCRPAEGEPGTILELTPEMRAPRAIPLDPGR